MKSSTIKNNLTKKLIIGNSDYCSYCGVIPTTIDHVIPWSVICGSTKDNNRMLHGLQTYSCRECNMLLGNRLILSIPERVLFVENKLKQRKKNMLDVPRWSSDEIEELDGRLKTYISGSAFFINETYSRISWRFSKTFNMIYQKMIEDTLGIDIYDKIVCGEFCEL